MGIEPTAQAEHSKWPPIPEVPSKRQGNGTVKRDLSS